MTRAEAAALLRGIYVIVNEDGDAVRLASAALSGGAHIIQYRAKRGVDPENAAALRDLTRGYGALFIINDDWRAALDCEADGVHVGPADASLELLPSLRNALSHLVIGVSCGTAGEAEAAGAADVDYLGVGAVFATESKADAGPPIGLAGLREVAAVTPLPVAAIGGITRERIAGVRDAGAAMAAVISAIARQTDPEAATRSLIRAWNQR